MRACKRGSGGAGGLVSLPGGLSPPVPDARSAGRTRGVVLSPKPKGVLGCVPRSGQPTKGSALRLRRRASPQRCACHALTSSTRDRHRKERRCPHTRTISTGMRRIKPLWPLGRPFTPGTGAAHARQGRGAGGDAP